MKSYNSIFNELETIRINSELEGISLEILNRLLARSIYENQIHQISDVLENSLLRSIKLDNKLLHSFHRNYSVFRGKNQRVLFKNLLAITNIDIKKFDKLMNFGEYVILAADNYSYKMNSDDSNEMTIEGIITKEGQYGYRDFEVPDNRLMIETNLSNISEDIYIELYDGEFVHLTDSNRYSILQDSNGEYLYYNNEYLNINDYTRYSLNPIFSNTGIDSPKPSRLVSSKLRSELLGASATYDLSAGCDNGYVRINGLLVNETLTYKSGSVVTIKAEPDEGYDFTGWSDGNPVNERTVTMNSNVTLTARTNIKSYTITSGLSNNGRIILSSNGVVASGNTFPYGTVVTLEAVPNSGCYFVKWSDGCVDRVRTITLDSNISLTPEFSTSQQVIQFYNVAVREIGVISRINGIRVNTGNYASGTSMSLNASLLKGYDQFSGWNDSAHTTNRVLSFTLTNSRNLTAVAVRTQYSISTSVTNGTITTSGLSVGDNDTLVNSNSGTYAYGTSAVINTTANVEPNTHKIGWDFVDWDNNDGCVNTTRHVIMDKVFTIKANYTIKTYILSCTCTEGGSVLIDGVARNTLTVNHGSTHAVSINLSEGFTRLIWEDSTTASITRSIGPISEDISLVARGIKASYSVKLTASNCSISIKGQSVSSGEPVEVHYGDQNVELVITPDEGYYLASWNVTDANPEYQVDGNKCIIKRVTGDQELSATVLINNFTVSATGNNCTITGTGVYDYGDQVTLVATPAQGYKFMCWSDWSTEPTKVINSINSNINLTAYSVLSTSKIVTFRVNLPTTGTKQSVLYVNNVAYTESFTGYYEENSVVEVRVEPAEGYRFVKWSDNNTSNNRQIILRDDITISPNIVIIDNSEYYLTIQSYDNTSVYVNNNLYTAPVKIKNDTLVNIVAVPNDGYRFIQWTDGDTNNYKSFKLQGATTLSLVSEPISDTYHTVRATTNSGTVYINNSAGNSRSLLEGSLVTLKVTPNSTYKFDQWSDGITDNPRSFLLTEDVSLTASCSLKSTETRTITITAANATVFINGNKATNYTGVIDTMITVSIVPDDEYALLKWSDGNLNTTRRLKVKQYNSQNNYTANLYKVYIEDYSGNYIKTQDGYVELTPNDRYNIVQDDNGDYLYYKGKYCPLSTYERFSYNPENSSFDQSNTGDYISMINTSKFYANTYSDLMEYIGDSNNNLLVQTTSKYSVNIINLNRFNKKSGDKFPNNNYYSRLRLHYIEYLPEEIDISNLTYLSGFDITKRTKITSTVYSTRNENHLSIYLNTLNNFRKQLYFPNDEELHDILSNYFKENNININLFKLDKNINNYTESDELYFRNIKLLDRNNISVQFLKMYYITLENKVWNASDFDGTLSDPSTYKSYECLDTGLPKYYSHTIDDNKTFGYVTLDNTLQSPFHLNGIYTSDELGLSSLFRLNKYENGGWVKIGLPNDQIDDRDTGILYCHPYGYYIGSVIPQVMELNKFNNINWSECYTEDGKELSHYVFNSTGITLAPGGGTYMPVERYRKESTRNELMVKGKLINGTFPAYNYQSYDSSRSLNKRSSESHYIFSNTKLFNCKYVVNLTIKNKSGIVLSKLISPDNNLGEFSERSELLIANGNYQALIKPIYSMDSTGAFSNVMIGGTLSGYKGDIESNTNGEFTGIMITITNNSRDQIKYNLSITSYAKSIYYYEKDGTEIISTIPKIDYKYNNESAENNIPLVFYTLNNTPNFNNGVADIDSKEPLSGLVAADLVTAIDPSETTTNTRYFYKGSLGVISYLIKRDTDEDDYTCDYVRSSSSNNRINIVSDAQLTEEQLYDLNQFMKIRYNAYYTFYNESLGAYPIDLKMTVNYTGDLYDVINSTKDTIYKYSSSLPDVFNIYDLVNLINKIDGVSFTVVHDDQLKMMYSKFMYLALSTNNIIYNKVVEE